jgi:hypothetical protein
VPVSADLPAAVLLMVLVLSISSLLLLSLSVSLLLLLPDVILLLLLSVYCFTDAACFSLFVAENRLPLLRNLR